LWFLFHCFQDTVMTSKINQNWAFGRGGGLSFSTVLPTPWTSAIGTWEGCASISDASGNLVMYTDGMNVFDSAGVVKVPGLKGNSSSTQSSIIVPNPGNPAEYYVFTADGTTGGDNHFDGARIDTTTWVSTPLSAIMAMPSTAGFSSTEKVTAIQHANCRDFWILTVIAQSSLGTPIPSGAGTLRVFRVNAVGVQHAHDIPMQERISDVGYLKGSGDGKRIALANAQEKNVLVYPFDNATGLIDVPNRVVIPVPTPADSPDHGRTPYGVEFSPSSRLLYYSVIGGTANGVMDRGYVFQHDLSGGGPSVPIDMHPNAGQAGRYALGALQLAMNGQIYIAQDGEARLGVIALPDVPGTGCKLTFSSVPLAPNTLCYMGLPNLIPNPCGCACDEGNCGAAVEDANKILNARADKKFFVINAKGQAPQKDCRPAFEQVDFAPHFSLHWGDGPNDQFESHDTEILYIRVRNPYRNLIYRGLKIFNIRITPNQVLPDGENALQLVPAEIVCFDEVGPCARVSRDFAFLIQNAVVQGYQISFEYCIEETAIVSAGAGRAAFDIKVVAS
jgi:hypothetical protein